MTGKNGRCTSRGSGYGVYFVNGVATAVKPTDAMRNGQHGRPIKPRASKGWDSVSERDQDDWENVEDFDDFETVECDGIMETAEGTAEATDAMDIATDARVDEALAKPRQLAGTVFDSLQKGAAFDSLQSSALPEGAILVPGAEFPPMADGFPADGFPACAGEKPRLEAARVAIDARDRDGATALMHAARSGRASLAALLIDQGADTEAADDSGRTALILAAQGGHTDVVRLLLTGVLDTPSGNDAAAEGEDAELAAVLAQVEELERGVPRRAAVPVPRDHWQCAHCTLINSCARRVCDACLVARTDAYQTGGDEVAGAPWRGAREADLMQVRLGKPKHRTAKRAPMVKRMLPSAPREVHIAHADGTWSKKLA